MSDAWKALDKLRAGNARFVAGESSIRFDEFLKARDRLAAAQPPFAVILGCSDSRVPVEPIFDQGLGRLFLIRIAGNIAYPSQLGSVEYAVKASG
ncbi:MAG: carbonic anhydrase [Pseudomonadota bacterium]